MKKKGAKVPSTGTVDRDQAKHSITMILGSYDKEDRAKILECCHDNIIDRGGDSKAAHELLDDAAEETYLVDAERITELLGID
jgi:hypothetical protein